MKYGIFSDIHSNYDAFSEVLKFYEKEKIQKFICAGDIIGYGAEPDKCIKEIKEINALCVLGNHESALLHSENLEYFNDYAYYALKWHEENMNYFSKDFLAKIPLKVTEGLFTVYHGSAFEPERFHYILSPVDYLKNLNYFDTPILIVGHTHVSEVFYYDEEEKISGQIYSDKFEIKSKLKYIINVGSVGQPRDRDKRACFCIYDDETHLFTIIRQEYDVKSAMKKIIDANLPAELAYRLEVGV